MTHTNLLMAHLNKAQFDACTLECLIKSIETLDNEGNSANEVTGLLRIAVDLSNKLTNALASAGLPEAAQDV